MLVQVLYLSKKCKDIFWRKFLILVFEKKVSKTHSQGLIWLEIQNYIFDSAGGKMSIPFIKYKYNYNLEDI